MVKLLIYTGLFLFSSLANACSCMGNEESIEEVYERADGIYMVAIAAINRAKKSKNTHSTQLDLDLEIIDSIKGRSRGVLKAEAYGYLPKKDKKGEVYMTSSSCDMNLSFGKSYTLAVKHGEKIKIQRCNPQILNDKQWLELKKYKNPTLTKIIKL